MSVVFCAHCHARVVKVRTGSGKHLLADEASVGQPGGTLAVVRQRGGWQLHRFLTRDSATAGTEERATDHRYTCARPQPRLP